MLFVFIVLILLLNLRGNVLFVISGFGRKILFIYKFVFLFSFIFLSFYLIYFLYFLYFNFDCNLIGRKE